MMKNIRRLLSVLLVLLLMLGIAVPAFAEAGEPAFDYYVLMGDSIPLANAADIPMNDYDKFGFRVNTYPDLLVNDLGIPEAYNLAHSGWIRLENAGGTGGNSARLHG